MASRSRKNKPTDHLDAWRVWFSDHERRRLMTIIIETPDDQLKELAARMEAAPETPVMDEIDAF